MLVVMKIAVDVTHGFSVEVQSSCVDLPSQHNPEMLAVEPDMTDYAQI
jgi:hypothetical protein